MVGRNSQRMECKKRKGIEWIGEIPEDWKISQIGQMYVERREKVSDKDFIPLSVTMNGILLQLSSAAKTEAHDDRKLVKQGDFVINSRSDRRGSCGISKYNGSVSLINIVLRPNENIESSYYDWLFHSTVFSNEFYKWGHGIVDDLWTTKWQDMKKISVPVPTMSEQKKIADYLCMKCEMIENVLKKTKATVEKYRNLKQSIITEVVTKGLKNNRLMKESELGWTQIIPNDWNIVKIKHIGKTSSGTTPMRSKDIDYFKEATIRWVRTLDLNDWLVNDSSEKITERALENSSCSIMPKNTVCVAMYGGSGTIGKCGILTKESATNQAICSIVCNEEKIVPMYLLFQLLALKKYWMYYAVGTRKDPNISQDIVGKMKVLLPSLDEQNEIVNYLAKKCAEIDKVIEKKSSL